MRFRGRSPALSEVAGRAGGGDVVPGRAAAVGARNHVIERQVPAPSAILTAEAVAEEDIEPREGRMRRRFNIIPKRNDRGQPHCEARAMHDAVVFGDDRDTVEKGGLDRRLPRPEAERIIG